MATPAPAPAHVLSVAPRPPRMTVAEAADQLGVAPKRVRDLMERGALPALPGEEGLVRVSDVEELVRRDVVRSVDIAAVEAAVDRALRRRIPGLLDESLDYALAPVADELAVAVADVELTTEQWCQAEERVRNAEAALAEAEDRIDALEAKIRALQAQPVGLFRRRRS